MVGKSAPDPGPGRRATTRRPPGLERPGHRPRRAGTEGGRRHRLRQVMELTPRDRTSRVRLWWSPDRAGIGAALADHDEIFGRLVEARPRDRTLLIARFHYFGRRRRWKEAAEIAARIIELDPKDGMGPGLSSRPAAIHRRCRGLSSGDREALAAPEGTGSRPCRRSARGCWDNSNSQRSRLPIPGQPAQPLIRRFHCPGSPFTARVDMPARSVSSPRCRA